MNRAERWLHGRRAALRFTGVQGEETLTKSLAGLGALAAAGAIPAGVVEEWRAALADPSLPQHPEARERAEAHLQGLLAEGAIERMEPALHLFQEVGAVDFELWDARLRERAGWPSAEEERAEEEEMNAAATEDDLRAILPGPPERRGGRRLLLALRFADSVRFEMEEDDRDGDRPDWALVDGSGTRLLPSGNVSFRLPPPGAPQRLRLVDEDNPDASFEVEL